MAVEFNSPPMTQDAIANGDNCLVYFIPNGVNKDTSVPYSGADSTTSVPKGIGLLCTLTGANPIPLTPLVEETYRAMGKQDFMYTSGKKIDNFDLTFDAGNLNTLYAMFGKDFSSATANALSPHPDWGVCGHLLFRYWNQAGDLQTSVLIKDLSVKMPNIPAASAAGERVEMTLTFYKSSAAEIWMTQGSKTFGVAFWKDPAINADAPDGVNTAFVVGTGNINGGTGATSPIPLILDNEVRGSAASDLKKYWVTLALDGVEQQDTDVTYTNGTQTLTYGTAPATGKALLGVYLFDGATALPENLLNTGTTTIVEAEEFGWPSYI